MLTEKTYTLYFLFVKTGYVNLAVSKTFTIFVLDKGITNGYNKVCNTYRKIKSTFSR